MNVRDRIEQGFEAWGHLVYRHPWLTLAAVAILVTPLLAQLPKLELDTRSEAFLHEDDPRRIAYNDFRALFGRDELILVTIRTPEIFSFPFLEKLRDLHDQIESEVPLLVEVTSLINARNTYAEGDVLYVDDLMEEWPETEADLAILRERALANPIYRNMLLSEGGDVTSVIIETEAYSQQSAISDELGGFEDETVPAGPRQTLTGQDNALIVEALYGVVEPYEAPDFEIWVAGSPTMNKELLGNMQGDMRKFTLLALIAIAGFLFVLFRRIIGALLPVTIVVLSLLTTLALMALSGTALMVPTQILPSFLLAVGVGSSVHILAIFYQARRRGEEPEDAVAYALGHSGLAVVMTSLTTAAGLFSFSVAGIAPISHLGIFGPAGILTGLLFTIVLLPALIAVLPARPERKEPQQHPSPSQQLLVKIGLFSTRNAWAVVLATAGLLVFCLVGAAQLYFSSYPLLWFPEEHPFRAADALVNDEMRGSMFLEIVLETESEDGFKDPELLKRLEELQRFAIGIERGDLYVGKTLALSDVVKEIHLALNESRPEFYSIPQDRLLVAQELLLFENSGSDDLEDFVDSTFQVGRFTLKTPSMDAVNYTPFLDLLQEKSEEILGPGVKVTLTGIMEMMTRTVEVMMYTMASSYAIALVIITPLMILLIGRVRIGLVSMLPNLTPIIITLGLMGWTGIPLDPFTIMIGGISIGLSVDDTIHFLHNFRRYYEQSGSVEHAVSETLKTSGQAMLFTTLVLTAGFLVFAQSSMTRLHQFGLLTSLTITLAFLADLTLAPALMKLIARPRKTPALNGAQMETS